MEGYPSVYKAVVAQVVGKIKPPSCIQFGTLPVGVE